MPALDHLAGLFYSDLAELGTFEEVLAESTPEPYRTLLAHHEHMTVSVEQHHGSPVDVEVLAASRERRLLLPQDHPAPAVGSGASCCSAFRGSTCGWSMTTCGAKSSSEIDAARPRADRAQRAPRSAARLALSRHARARTCADCSASTAAADDLRPHGVHLLRRLSWRSSCWRSSRPEYRQPVTECRSQSSVGALVVIRLSGRAKMAALPARSARLCPAFEAVMSQPAAAAESSAR